MEEGQDLPLPKNVQDASGRYQAFSLIDCVLDAGHKAASARANLVTPNLRISADHSVRTAVFIRCPRRFSF